MRIVKFMLAAAIAAGAAGTAAAETGPSRSGKNAEFRVRSSPAPDYTNARPFPLPRAAPLAGPQAALIERGADARFPGPPSFVEGGEGTGAQTPESVPVSRALLPEEPAPAPEFGGADLPYTTSLVRPADQTYNRIAGKIFMKQTDGGTYVCSGALVKPGVVATAAHCVADFGKNVFYSDWVFIPAYQRGRAPYGRWPVRLALAPKDYLDGSNPCAKNYEGTVCRDDVAVLVLRPKAGKYPGHQTGWFGWAVNGYGFNSESQVQLTQLGYPQGLNHGEMQIRTDAQGSVEPDLLDNTLFGSLQTGGSSGGPLLINFGDAATRTGGTSVGKQADRNVLIGVLSWGTDNRKAQGASPFTEANISTLVSDACARFPRACEVENR